MFGCRSCRHAVVLTDEEGTIRAAGCWNHKVIRRYLLSIQKTEKYPSELRRLTYLRQAIPVRVAWPFCLGDREFWKSQPAMFDLPRIRVDEVKA